MSKDQSAFQNVPRETFLKLDQYRELLLKWQNAINLISNEDITDIWSRHIWDSFQLIKHLQEGSVLDIGSGGGFPGVVIAIATDFYTNLVESDQRKSLFLEEVKLKLNLANLKIHNLRIENLTKEIKFDNITARAFSTLNKMIPLSKPLLTHYGQCLFLKGSSYNQELEEALSEHKFEYEVIDSQTNKKSKIIRIRKISDE